MYKGLQGLWEPVKCANPASVPAGSTPAMIDRKKAFFQVAALAKASSAVTTDLHDTVQYKQQRILFIYCFGSEILNQKKCINSDGVRCL